MKYCIGQMAWTMIVLAVTAIRSLAQSTYEPYTFTTLAGDVGYGSADGTGNAARFYAPYGVAVDSAGNAYVADTDNDTVRKVTSPGVVTTLAGSPGNCGSGEDGIGSAARFCRPFGVAVDSVGNVYVANGYIRKVTPAGVVTTLVGLSGIAVAVDTAGNLYLAAGNSIQKATLVGTNWVVTTMAGMAGSFGSADGTGNAARFGGLEGGLPEDSIGPRGVAVDSAGNVYVADTANNTIRKVTPAGVVTTLAGLAGVRGTVDGTGSAARFSLPQGVAVDSAGNVYVADSWTAMIRKVTPAGVVTTLAGLAGNYGSADGTGSAARFGRDPSFCPGGPRGVAVDSAGNVYVADTCNNTIRKGFPATMILNSGPGFGFNRGQFGFNLAGPVGQLVVVEASTDLMSWLPLWTNSFSFPAALNFNDLQSGVYSNRFYRAHLP